MPLDFSVGGSVSEVITTGLPIGDYWATWEDGTEMPIAIERKSLIDLAGTLTSGYSRFKREIMRAVENKIKLVLIVEGSISEVLTGSKYSEVEGKSILKTMFTLWLKYDVVPVFVNDREEMKRFILETFESCGRNFKPGASAKNASAKAAFKVKTA